jgi:hypothetical protein
MYLHGAHHLWQEPNHLHALEALDAEMDEFTLSGAD